MKAVSIINNEFNKHPQIYLICLIVVLTSSLIILFYNIHISEDFTYKAYKLPKQIGENSRDTSCSNGFCRFDNSNQSGFLVFGPYVNLPRGTYIVTFRVKTDNKSENVSPIAKIDVFTIETGELVNESIYSSQNIDNSTFQSVKLSFESKGQRGIEFRVFKQGSTNLSIDTINIRSISRDKMGIIFLQQKLPMFLLVILTIITIILTIEYTYKRLSLYKLLNAHYLFWLVFIAYTSTALEVFGKVFMPTGDEPHYLLTTFSIVNDRDIYLKNNYLNEDYLQFFPSPSIDPHIAINLAGQWLPSHDIGLPIILSIPYMLFGLTGSRIFMGLITAILIVNIFHIITILLNNGKISFASCILAAIISPLLFYSNRIYPETMAALILVYSAKLLYRKIYNNVVKSHEIMFGGILIATLPWFGIKYISLMIPLALLMLKYNSEKKSDVARVATPIVISIVAYIIFMIKMFGTISPGSRYNGLNELNNISGVNQFSTTLSISNLLSPSILASYFFDQQVGLIVYSPIYLLSIIGLIYLCKKIKSKKDLEMIIVLFLPSASYFALYIMKGAWGGACPPSRAMIAIIGPIILLMAIGTNAIVAMKLNRIVHILIALSIAISGVLLKEPSLQFPNPIIAEKSNMLLNIGGYPLIDITSIFPSFIWTQSLFNWALLLLWLAIISSASTMEYIYNNYKKHE